MEGQTGVEMPTVALQRLEFYVGEFEGTQTLYAPEGESPLAYPAFCQGRREACDRFMQIDFYADVPDRGPNSFTAFLTYSTKRACYEMWLFSSTTEEPLHMVGDFRGECLVMVSDPWPMEWGLQRLRGTMELFGEDSFTWLIELWEPDGYRKLRTTTFARR